MADVINHLPDKEPTPVHSSLAADFALPRVDHSRVIWSAIGFTNPGVTLGGVYQELGWPVLKTDVRR